MPSTQLYVFIRLWRVSSATLGTWKGIAIGIGVAVLAIAAFTYFSQGNTFTFAKLNPIDMTQDFTTPKTPTATYSKCESTINGTYENPREDRIATSCDGNNDGRIGDVRFTFELPPSMDDFYRLDVKSSVYKYADGSYELGLYDSVGEKRYTLKIWEFPQ